MRPSRRDQPHDRERQRGLARAALADDAEGLAGADRERGVVDRLDVADGLAQQAALDREPDAQVVGLDDGRRRRRAPGRGGRSARRRAACGCRGAAGAAKIARGRAGLDDLAVLHHRDPVGDAAHDAEVVGDEQHPHALGLLHVGEQRQDLGLDRHVERGGGLVGDQDVGAVGQRHGDHHPLALAAGELVRDRRRGGSRRRGCRPGSAARGCGARAGRRSGPGAAPGSRRSAARWCAAG